MMLMKMIGRNRSVFTSLGHILIKTTVGTPGFKWLYDFFIKKNASDQSSYKGKDL
jgi:hypothetical protein